MKPVARPEAILSALVQDILQLPALVTDATWDSYSTVAEVGERAGAALDEIGRAAPDGSTVVVVMHGVAARAGVCQLVGFPAETWKRLSGLHNCGWISVERHRTGDYWRITEYNVTAPRP